MPTTVDGTAGRRLALVIATGSYTDPTLTKLRAPGRDATDLAAVLEDAAVGGFQVETVLDAPAEELRRRVARFCAAIGPGDLALVYLSCHGVLDDRGRLYYATADTDRSLLSATAVSSAWLNEQLEDSRGRRQILVLDCCHSGAFAKGAKGESDLALARRFEGRGRVVLTGSRGTEYSFEHDHVVGKSVSSVFTGSLVEGLRSGEADRDGDGLVTVNELYEYVYDAVRAKEARQTPTLWSYGAEGDLLVARSPKGAIAPPDPPRPAMPSPPSPPPTTPPDPSMPASPPPPRRRRVAVGAGAGLALVVAALLVALLPRGGEGEGDAGAPHAQPGTIEVDGTPSGIALGESAAWVARYEAGEVGKLGSSSGIEKSTEVGPQPEKMVAGEGWVWASLNRGNELARIDPITLDVETASLEKCGCSANQLVIAEGKLWVGSATLHAIVTFDLDTGEQLPTRYHPGPGFTGTFDVGGGTVWAVGTDEEGGSVSWLSRLDPVTGAKQGKRTGLGTGGHFEAIAYGGETVWIADAADGHNLVAAFDTEKLEIVKEIKIDSGVTSDDLAVAGGTVLLWDADGGLLTLINTDEKRFEETLEPIRGYASGRIENHQLSDLAVADGLAWITDPVANKVHKVRY